VTSVPTDYCDPGKTGEYHAEKKKHCQLSIKRHNDRHGWNTSNEYTY
jgi:hypothetical protein